MALLLHPRLPSHPFRAAAHHHHAISDASCFLTLHGPGRKRRMLLAAVTCRAARVKEPAPSAGASPPPPPQALTKEAHKYFDHAVVTVRAGDGPPRTPPSPAAGSTGARRRARRCRTSATTTGPWRCRRAGTAATLWCTPTRPRRRCCGSTRRRGTAPNGEGTWAPLAARSARGCTAGSPGRRSGYPCL
jgi:hypothetical protein